jgi:hypothetical protein
LQRKLAGPMAPWDMNALLLRQILHTLQGANWQRGGGKGQKPKPIDLPDSKKQARSRSTGAETAQRLKNLGMLPPDTPI